MGQGCCSGSVEPTDHTRATQRPPAGLALCASWLELPTGVTAVAGPVVPTLPGGPQVLSIAGQCLLGAGLAVCGPRQVTLGSVWGHRPDAERPGYKAVLLRLPSCNWSCPPSKLEAGRGCTPLGAGAH